MVKEKDNLELVWKYNPLKRDGRNAERKAYFRQLVGSLDLRIPFPREGSVKEMNTFMDNLFKLCQVRQKADRVTEVFKDSEWA